MKVAILIANDGVYVGNRVHPALAPVTEIIEKRGDRLVYSGSVPESRDMVEMELEKLCDRRMADILLTIGGTGFSVRDCLPEATRAVRDHDMPELSEKLKDYCREAMKQGLLYRTETGIRSETVIVNLPGEDDMVTDCLEMIYGDLL